MCNKFHTKFEIYVQNLKTSNLHSLYFSSLCGNLPTFETISAVGIVLDSLDKENVHISLKCDKFQYVMP